MATDFEQTPGEDDAYHAHSARAQGTNIDPQTLLATDYLNHFNEIVMLLELIPDMPECLEDAEAWQPKSYQDHFRDSQFRDRELAVEAYEYVPPCYREPFDDVISQMNRIVPLGLQRIRDTLGAGEPDRLRMICSEVSQRLQKMIDIASAIIHGSTKRLDQAEIDGFLAD
ncbi:MAG TPA: hypothetical protein VKP60_13570 [Magnetospirillaceae bacterium]|nr:hypothetical protein [Magnetospirillaceae bacterium]